jgi:cell division protein ZapA
MPRWPIPMAELTIRVGGRHYPLACRDGEETRLAELARGLDARVGELTRTLGTMGEGRLLIALAITLADELAEADTVLDQTVQRVEAMADALEVDLPTP